MKNCYLSKLWALAIALLAWTATTDAQIVKITVNDPAGIAGDYQALQAAFSPALTGTTGDVVYADPANGCTAPLNSLTGSVALMDRGTCGFAIKAVVAQQAGAIAVIVCNNTPDFPHKALVMGGTPTETINIPVVMLSWAACETIKANLADGVNVTFSPDPIPPGAGEVCATAIPIGPGTHTVAEISGGFGAVFVSGVLDNNSNAKWYSYTPTVNNIATVSSCGQLVDSRLAIISGADCAALTLLDINDDCDPDNGDFASELSFLAVAGQQYFIYWDDRWDHNGFDFTLSENTTLPQALVTFNVDMALETVSPDGVRVAYGTSSNPVLTEAILADGDGDGVYSGSANITVLDTVGYVFVNGMVTAGNQESVPNDCGVPSIFGFNFRPFIVFDPAGTNLPSVCFSSCGDCIFVVDDCADPFIIIADDAEGYTAGPVIGQPGADHFGVWPGGAGFDVTTEQAASGANSFKVSSTITGQDALLLFGDKTQDHYVARWDMYIATGKRAYFNVQHQAPTASAGFWAMDAFFGDEGDGSAYLTIYPDNVAAETPRFSYPNDTWFEVYLYVDLDNDEARLLVDETTVAAWKFSDGITNGGAASPLNQLNSIDFYPRDANDEFYIDNIDYWQIPDAGVGQYCYTAVDIQPGVHTVPELSCFGGGYDLGGGDGGEKGYWFTYTPTQDGVISISSCGGGADSRGWIFKGECHGLEVVGVNDDMCELTAGSSDLYASYREAIVEAGQTYYILWDNAWEPVGFDFELAFSTDAPAEGDFCQTAVAVTPGEYAVEEFTGDAAAAGPTIGTSTLSETPYANSEWYSFTPTTNGTMTITSCNGAASDTRLWVYTGDCATLSGLTVVAESDDDCLGTAGPSQVVDVPVTAGTTYLIEWNDRFSEDAFLWELIFNPLTVDVTFQVDMALSTIDPSGVFLAGSFSDFQNLPMSDGNGDGVYTATVAIPENTTVTYKFKNGTDGWETVNTTVGGVNCTTGGFGDRFYNTTTTDVTLPVVCFAYCVACNVVDADEVTLLTGVKIFPNPVNDVLNIRYDFSETVQQFNIRIYNAQGALVYDRYMGQSLNGAVEIDSRQFPAGAYMVQLMDGASQVTRKVIIE